MTKEEKQKAITTAGNPAKPTGEAGEQMLARMNESHAPLTAWGLSHFTWRGDEAVLDIGCGGGANLRHMSAHVTTGHLTGIDYSATSVQTSRQTNAAAIAAGKMEINEGSVEALPFADNTFDKITTVESFYFWPKPQENLKEVRRVLKPGGTFLLIAEIYGHDGLSAEVRENIKRYHLYNPTPETFETIFRNAGFPSVQVHIEKDHRWICIEGQKKQCPLAFLATILRRIAGACTWRARLDDTTTGIPAAHSGPPKAFLVPLEVQDSCQNVKG